MTAVPPQVSMEPEEARPSAVVRWGVIAVLAAQVVRTAVDEGTQRQGLPFAALIGAYLMLFAIVGWRPRHPPVLLHAYFVLQSALVVAMLTLNPDLDSITAFFIPLAFQAALLFAGPSLWAWVGLLVLISAASLIAYRGLLPGLALAMSPAAFVVALPSFMVANRESELARRRSQALLVELEEARRQLQAYAGQVEELASLRERSRLARELHDTVSQLVFSITLTSRSTQLLLERDPARVREQLERLRETCSSALGQLRSLITQMRL